MKNKALANEYLSTFCKELALLIQAGIALGDGILMLRDDEEERDGKAVLQSLLHVLDRGGPLSAALRGSGYFPLYMANMAQIGEKTGRLAEVLKALSEHYDRQDRLAVSIKNAVLYPAILLVMMMAVVLILIVKVLPIFNDVFNQLGSRMSPLATRLMRFGGWIGDTSVVIAAIVGAVAVLALALWAIPAARACIFGMVKDRLGSGGIFGKIASSRFLSAMALAIASGLDTGEAVEMAAAISGGSKAVDERNRQCAERLRGGETLSDAMRGAGILSARDSRMLALGSRGGAADEAMAEIARRSERNVRDEIDRMVGWIEPALVMITSVMVGIILLSVMLPLTGIMTSIG